MKYKIINKKKLIATILFDIVGFIFFQPFKIFKKKGGIEQDIKEILIIRTAYVGDIIMTLPILTPLKEKFPQARISFIASKEGAELLQGNPHIDRIFRFNPFWFYKTSIKAYLLFLFKIRKERFDLVIEARGDIRDLLFIVFPLKSRFKLSYGFGGGRYFLSHVVPFTSIKHRIEYHLDLARYLDCNTEDIEWKVYLTKEEEKGIVGIMQEYKIEKPFLSVHPGARVPLKMWMIERYAKLYDMIMREYRMPLLILGSREEKAIADKIITKMKNRPINLAGMISLKEVAGILKESALFICNDSAPMHIAAAMGTPTVAVFGPSKSIETGPYKNKSRIVEKDFPCRFTCDENVCKHRVFHGCMKAITPDDVFSAVKELI
ncbi:MAG: glycosyltransferase family 9 protein [Thermodesulfobacteriota bacterium]|nr:glycosyltransferase family 9 protein [Thermodesulfobacteriota bacterium]